MQDYWKGNYGIQFTMPFENADVRMEIRARGCNVMNKQRNSTSSRDPLSRVNYSTCSKSLFFICSGSMKTDNSINFIQSFERRYKMFQLTCVEHWM